MPGYDAAGRGGAGRTKVDVMARGMGVPVRKPSGGRGRGVSPPRMGMFSFNAAAEMAGAIGRGGMMGKAAP